MQSRKIFPCDIGLCARLGFSPIFQTTLLCDLLPPSGLRAV
jgi:hypothetical protein